MPNLDYISTYNVGFWLPFVYSVLLFTMGFVLAAASHNKPLRQVAIQAWFKKNVIHVIGLWLAVCTVAYCLSIRGFTTYCFTMALANFLFVGGCVFISKARKNRS